MTEPSQAVKYYLRAFALLVILVCTCLSLWHCTPRVTEEFYLVTKVIDGDTVELSSGEKLRYIGIDTPEKKEPFYSEAKNYNRRLLEGKKIKIELDVQENDKYGRLLGYVYVDGIFVNAEMLKAGLATSSAFCLRRPRFQSKPHTTHQKNYSSTKSSSLPKSVT